jgi:hypothetical protein
MEEARTFEILEKTDTSKPNRHLSFFQGILPSLQNLNNDQTMEFQLGVMNFIKNVKKHRPSFPTQNFASQHARFQRLQSNTSSCKFLPTSHSNWLRMEQANSSSTVSV